ncbi:hypothetical protein MYAM1_003226 [Malassezia yamatoensis]|uniref:Amidohydrolase-related domain-containing protein n=1 Tax=Malassezia yamatoensis TaxID=253288 RepID=A0AAJ5YXD4_9BASI|nr:hypothetical protein MYAM1_003226 [Malassezia yamatoensis]
MSTAQTEKFVQDIAYHEPKDSLDVDEAMPFLENCEVHASIPGSWHARVDRSTSRKFPSLSEKLWAFLFAFTILSQTVSFLGISSSLTTSLNRTLTTVSNHFDHPASHQKGKEADLLQCQLASAVAGPPPNFSKRKVNDRFWNGTQATYIINATVWTGNEILSEMDLILDRGLIQSIEKSGGLKNKYNSHANTIHASGRWVTPGIVDMHTHLGVMGMPAQASTTDSNSRQGATRPMMRSIDGFNEHDQDIRKTVSGGITTVMVLPGSLNNIGGQAYPMKLGPLHGKAPSSRVLDPPSSLVMPGDWFNGRDALYDPASGMQRGNQSTSFRHLKMACGENARQYGLVRMDEAWNFRREFERAQKLKRRQDDYCYALHQKQSPQEASFPSELELDSLVDVLRGRTKVHTHCYTMNDLDALVRHSTEFGFPVAAFHHAHETYLVADLLHKAYEHPPAVAMFSQNANYKYEAYFGTPFAGALLDQANITPIFKSDHPVLDSRRLIHQAAEAHHYGLSEIAALKSVTSAPAHVMGLAHRIGHIQRGADADVVLWDRHPLQLGATPMQVYIDGEAQFSHPFDSGLTTLSSSRPKQADYRAEHHRVQTQQAEIVDDRAFAFPTPAEDVSYAILYNVQRFFHRQTDANGRRIVEETFSDNDGVLVYADGSLVCVGKSDCLALAPKSARRIDLGNGTILPGLIAYGATLGLADLPMESSASAGKDESSVDEQGQLRPAITPRIVDELMWGGHDLLRAHASGVTTCVNAPAVKGVAGGISAQFDTNVRNVLDAYSVRASDVAMHIQLSHSGPSWAMQIQMIRDALKHPPTEIWERVTAGKLPLVVKVDAQTLIAQLILLCESFPELRLVLDSSGPLHLVAKQLSAHNIGVLLPPRVWLYGWDSIDRLAGPPLSKDTELSVLLRHNVKVGLRIGESWEATKLLWDTIWAAQEAHITDLTQILELITTNLETLLDLPEAPNADFVAFHVRN